METVAKRIYSTLRLPDLIGSGLTGDHLFCRTSNFKMQKRGTRNGDTLGKSTAA